MIPDLKGEAELITVQEKLLNKKKNLYFTHNRKTNKNFNSKQEFQLIINILMYLCVTTRFDIVFVVHQIGRLTLIFFKKF